MENPDIRLAKQIPDPASQNVRIKVANFGPIANAAVDLRPLTVFVGPSNTGKTYLAILIYALHKALEGFSRLPPVTKYFYRAGKEMSISDSTTAEVISSFDVDKRPFFFSDLPEIAQNTTQNIFQNPNYMATDLKEELERCFDLKDAVDLIGSSTKLDKMDVSLMVESGGKELWNFSMGVSNSTISADGKIKDMVLIPETISDSDDEVIFQILWRELNDKKMDNIFFFFMEFLNILSYLTRNEKPDSHYLPAARSGIMQSHRVIASSLVARSTRAALERFPELPTFSGVMSDFMQRLILHDAADLYSRHGPRRKPSKALLDLVDVLERKTLDGSIQTITESPNGYPEFVYRPRNSKKPIRLNRASSMVSELAPVVLFLRNNIREGDTFVIEEPEAHLHPAAQTEMATVLAQLVRSGVRVVATTHSDWLLKAIANLMRQGELGAVEDGLSSPSSLQPHEVGIWLFRKNGAAGSAVEEIPFDRIEGIEPTDYEDVAEQLYNRSADLQNKLERMANKA